MRLPDPVRQVRTAPEGWGTASQATGLCPEEPSLGGRGLRSDRLQGVVFFTGRRSLVGSATSFVAATAAALASSVITATGYREECAKK